MFPEKDPQLEKIMHQLSPILDLRYVFKSQLRSTASKQPLMIVLHQGSTATVTQAMIAKMNLIFKQAPAYTFKVFPLKGALNSLKQHNLFFMQHCQAKNLIYPQKNAHLQQFNLKLSQGTFDLAREQIDRQLSSCVHHLDAACEYKEEGSYTKALHCLYSYQKNVMDIAAAFHFGQPFQEVLLSECQKLFAPYDTRLGTVYDTGNKQDGLLLHYLDQTATGNLPTSINAEQIVQITTKANTVLKATLNLFRKQLLATKHAIKKRGKPKQLPQTGTSGKEQKIREDLQKLVDRKILELRPGHEKIYYKAHLKIDGTADIMYHIAAMLKVCILALGNDHTDRFPEPKLNIQTTLEHILDLLPFEEMECLERIIHELEINTNHYVLEPPKCYYA